MLGMWIGVVGYGGGDVGSKGVRRLKKADIEGNNGV